MTNKEIATTILQQLGGRRFIAMTGAKNFTYDKNMLVFQIPRHNNIRHVRITLQWDDLYTMEFLNVGNAAKPVKTIAKHENVFFDQLQPIFTQETGLYTHL